MTGAGPVPVSTISNISAINQVLYLSYAMGIVPAWSGRFPPGPSMSPPNSLSREMFSLSESPNAGPYQHKEFKHISNQLL